MITISEDLAVWIIRQAGGKRVKETNVIAGDSKPTWRYEKGWTRWKNGKPKHYTPSESTVTVGADWLAARFPVAWCSMRLAGTNCLEVTGDDILASERLMLEMERWQERTQQTEQAWNIVQRIKECCRSTDPETEVLYA